VYSPYMFRVSTAMVLWFKGTVERCYLNGEGCGRVAILLAALRL
jgi:hypothetical protein